MPDPYREIRRMYGATSQAQLLQTQVSSAWGVSQRLEISPQELSQLKLNIDTLLPRVMALPNTEKYKTEMLWQLNQADNNYKILLKAQTEKSRASIAAQQQMAADLSARVAQQAASIGDADKAAKAAEVAIAAANASVQASRTPKTVEDATATASAAQKAANDAYERSMQTSECFIASAAFGSPLEPEVDSLRRFRHKILEPNKMGHLMVRTYYVVSPPIARGVLRSDTLRSMVRALLHPIINTFGR